MKTKPGTNIGGAGAHNKRVVMQALRLNGDLSRAEIARGTRLVPQTVSNIIEELEQDGLVIPSEQVKGKRGQPATPYRISAFGAFALGMQVDQYGAKAVVVNLLGEVISKSDTTFDEGSLEENLPQIKDLIEVISKDLRKLAPTRKPKIVGMGVAMPAPTGIHAVKTDPWMIAPRENHPMLSSLEKMTGLPVSLHHDASAAAVAERLNGCAKGIDNFVQIFIGQGLGAGLYMKGELYVGKDNLAGELGQIPIFRGADVAPLEQVASLSSLYALLHLRPNDPNAFSKIQREIETQSMLVLEWVDKTAHHLAWLVDVLECVLDPEFIVVGGQMPQALMHALYVKIVETCNARKALVGINRSRLLMASPDIFSVAAGAAAYPIARAFDPSLSAILKYGYDEPQKNSV
jgi:predicted NBD/HSP70 family sugar kinase